MLLNLKIFQEILNLRLLSIKLKKKKEIELEPFFQQSDLILAVILKIYKLMSQLLLKLMLHLKFNTKDCFAHS
jgi:hypothetical protein